MRKKKPCIRNVKLVVAIVTLFAVQVWAGTATGEVLHSFGQEKAGGPGF